MMRIALIAPVVLVALAGCSQSPETTGNAAANAVDAATALPTPEPSPTPTTSAASTKDIPAALRGRWGMNANDCDPKQDFAAKGLMAVDATTLKFYESRATLGTVRAADANHLDADFAFTGEGQSWTYRVTLALAGDKLTRRDEGEGASPETLRYQRCAA